MLSIECVRDGRSEMRVVFGWSSRRKDRIKVWSFFVFLERVMHLHEICVDYFGWVVQSENANRSIRVQSLT